MTTTLVGTPDPEPEPEQRWWLSCSGSPTITSGTGTTALIWHYTPPGTLEG